MEREICQMTQRQFEQSQVDSLLAVTILRERGIWDQLDRPANGLASSLEDLLPGAGPSHDVGRRLLNALDDLAGRVASDSVLLAIICAGLRELSGMTLAKVARMLAESMDRVIEVYHMSRLIQVGELVSTFPTLIDISSFNRLLLLCKVPDDHKPQVFSCGVVNGVDIRLGGNDELDRAIATLNGSSEKEVGDRELRRNLRRARSVMIKMLRSLQGAEIYRDLLGPIEVAVHAMEAALEPVELEVLAAGEAEGKAMAEQGLTLAVSA